MADGDEDVVALITRFRDGVQGRDGPALDDVERVVDQAPFDVLGLTEMPFDPPAQALEPHDLRIRQHGAVLPLGLDRPFLRTAIRQGPVASFLVAIVFSMTWPSRTL